MQPLTHHEILELVAPVLRGGRHVDLAASDRLKRRLVFQPVEHPATAELPAMCETLTVEDAGAGGCRLIRELAPTGGPAACLEATGPRLADLVARIDAVPAQRQFLHSGGNSIAFSFRLASESAGSLVFVRGEAQVAGLVLILESSGVKAAAAAVRLVPGTRPVPRLPQDALAVLGRRWSRLRQSGDGWSGEVRLRGNGRPRSDGSPRCLQAEAALALAARHLGEMLAERPARFHERWIAARWRVFCRRLVPLAACVGLIACAAAVPKLHLAENSGLRMLILNSPPLLLILFFCQREIPIVELPPLPRRSDAASWTAGPEGGT